MFFFCFLIWQNTNKKNFEKKSNLSGIEGLVTFEIIPFCSRQGNYKFYHPKWDTFETQRRLFINKRSKYLP
jgi:hypothetical protein